MAMTTKRNRLTAALFLILFAGMAAAGIFRDEIPDVVSNARMICYSCIGLK